MKLDDFHKMVGITNEEQRRVYYRIHQLGLYSCMKCGEIIYDVMNGCPSCGYDGGRSEYPAPPEPPPKRQSSANLIL